MQLRKMEPKICWRVTKAVEEGSTADLHHSYFCLRAPMSDQH